MFIVIEGTAKESVCSTRETLPRYIEGMPAARRLFLMGPLIEIVHRSSFVALFHFVSTVSEAGRRLNSLHSKFVLSS
ncbi:hypothetical protein J6590_070185 [Homalodisca vitripennis]|nr:hypothetical protein J6590_070185 [Homalodisca vitripennis]